MLQIRLFRTERSGVEALGPQCPSAPGGDLFEDGRKRPMVPLSPNPKRFTLKARPLPTAVGIRALRRPPPSAVGITILVTGSHWEQPPPSSADQAVPGPWSAVLRQMAEMLWKSAYKAWQPVRSWRLFSTDSISSRRPSTRLSSWSIGCRPSSRPQPAWWTRRSRERRTVGACSMRAPATTTSLGSATIPPIPPVNGAYNGYASCPLVTGYGELVLAELGYDKERQERLPFHQTQERCSMYGLLKGHRAPVAERPTPATRPGALSLRQTPVQTRAAACRARPHCAARSRGPVPIRRPRGRSGSSAAGSRCACPLL